MLDMQLANRCLAIHVQRRAGIVWDKKWDGELGQRLKFQCKVKLSMGDTVARPDALLAAHEFGSIMRTRGNGIDIVV